MVFAWGQTIDPAERPQKVSPEIKNAHKRWIAEDAKYIISDAERKAFLALKTDEERENFIADFWRRRDPDAETEENEFREEYYQRIAYANEHFASGVPGWMTDRGRVLLGLGRPDQIYEQIGRSMSQQGRTQIWEYRNQGVSLTFQDQSGFGRWRLLSTSENEFLNAWRRRVR